MADKSKHDQISISSIDTVRSLRIIARLLPLRPDKIEKLMLSLSGNRSIREDYFELFVVRMVLSSLEDEELEGFTQSRHELCAWSDNI